MSSLLYVALTTDELYVALTTDAEWKLIHNQASQKGTSMYNQHQRLRWLAMISGAVLLGISPTRAADLTVDGVLKVNKQAYLLTNVQIGPTPDDVDFGGCPGCLPDLPNTLSVFGNVRVGGQMSVNEMFMISARQAISIGSNQYGIGVQKSAFYQRTGNEFFWYKGGTHTADFGDPGKDGTQLMRLGNSGSLVVSGLVTSPVLQATKGVITPVLQITGGSDVAEPFQITRGDIPKGAVVTIDAENAGNLKLSTVAYDTRVAGIVSGANGINPGISLSQKGLHEAGQNVALSGRVYVLADASSSPIEPGDLLTTSDSPGYAMKVTDYPRAQGAVIGKAMSTMKHGKGMVLVLVTLQ
ncbi:MAG: hypothetical protein QOJ99_4695 [Bryobacterales bacterium]|jgi:hypothetical protein|nr:hypothetical protein [Bryobacterales bacterium]